MWEKINYCTFPSFWNWRGPTKCPNNWRSKFFTPQPISKILHIKMLHCPNSLHSGSETSSSTLLSVSISESVRVKHSKVEFLKEGSLKEYIERTFKEEPKTTKRDYLQPNPLRFFAAMGGSFVGPKHIKKRIRTLVLLSSIGKLFSRYKQNFVVSVHLTVVLIEYR